MIRSSVPFFLVLLMSLNSTPVLCQEISIQDFESKVQLLISFFEFTLNTLGDPKTPTSEKEIIISQSYLKFFKDSEVQIEDDLVENREMVTNKDVQAYLKDVDFFYREVKFAYEVQTIEYSQTEAGDPFFKVTCNRNLAGFNLDGDSINNNHTRYIEINLDPVQNDLKIASIYTTGLSRETELFSWWENLSLEWTDILSSKIGVQASLTHSQILEVAQIEELDLSFNLYITDLHPVSELTELKVLNISNTKIEDLFPIRTLTNLETLHLSNTKVEDLQAIKYAIKITELDIGGTAVLNLQPISGFRNLTHLDFKNTQILELADLKGIASLRALDCSNSQLSSLEGIEGLKRLRNLDLSRTFVSSLEPTRGLDSLRELRLDRTLVIDLGPLESQSYLKILSFNETRIGSLKPIMDLPAIERVYADNTPISVEEARRFTDLNPERSLIFKSEVLSEWWAGTDAVWRDLLLSESGLEEPLSKEDLGKVIKIQKLDISGRTDIPSLEPIWIMVNLEELDCRSTPVDDLNPVRGLEKLRRINISKTHVVDLEPLEDLGMLEEIDVSQTSIRAIHSLGELALLSAVNLNSTPVDELSGLENHWYLKQIFIENTGVRTLSPLYGIRSLELVHADGSFLDDNEVAEFIDNNPDCVVTYQTTVLKDWWNSLSPKWRQELKRHINLEGEPGSRDLHRMTFLDELSVEDSEFPDLVPVERLIRIESLKLVGTNTTNLAPLRFATSLKHLQLPKNPVSDLIPISSLPFLESLDIENTAVVDLSPLNEMRSLAVLKISGTKVKSLKGVENLIELRQLECYSTPIKNLKPLDRLKRLEVLKCYNTKLSAKAVKSFQEGHPHCEVVYY